MTIARPTISRQCEMEHADDGTGCNCGFLISVVIVLTLTSLALLLLSVYLYRKPHQVSEKRINSSPSFAFGEHCKINSFTCLELRKEKQDSSKGEKQKNEQIQGRLKDQRLSLIHI